MASSRDGSETDASQRHHNEDGWIDELQRGLSRMAHAEESDELPASHGHMRRHVLYRTPRVPQRPLTIDERLVADWLEREQAVAHRAPLLEPALFIPRPAPSPTDLRLEREAEEAQGGRRLMLEARVKARRAARIFLQISLIVCVCLAGERLADALPIDVPGNICSMIVLLVFLITGTLKMETISDGADFLLDHMSIFFIPAAVAIMGSFNLIADNVVKLVLICLITTVLVFFVTSFTVSTMMNLMTRHEAREGGEQGAAQAMGQMAAGVAQISGTHRLGVHDHHGFFHRGTARARSASQRGAGGAAGGAEKPEAPVTPETSGRDAR